MNNIRIFKSRLATYMKMFLEYRESMNMSINTTQWTLKSFDDYLVASNISKDEISEDIVKGWIESWGEIKVKSKNRKIHDIRAFLKYISQMGVQCYIPCTSRDNVNDFVPYIFSHEEISRLFTASNQLVLKNYVHNSLLMPIPALIRLLYSTGIRIGEAVSLKNKDILFERHVIVLNQTKNHSQRLAPINKSLEEVLKTYIYYRNKLPFDNMDAPDSYFLVSGKGKRLDPGSINLYFKKLLTLAGIPYLGGGNGPRIHDLRHTACVHSMAQLVEEGKDIYCCLPMLATFMGHKDLRSTEHYVRLTKEMFPNLITKDSVLTSEINNIIKNATNGTI